MKRKANQPEEQGSLFKAAGEAASRAPRGGDRRDAEGRAWKMPEVSGKTVAEIRLRWNKRLTPAQATRVEAELSRVPALLTKLGYGTVQVERAFVRRRKG